MVIGSHVDNQLIFFLFSGEGEGIFLDIPTIMYSNSIYMEAAQHETKLAQEHSLPRYEICLHIRSRVFQVIKAEIDMKSNL